MATARKKPAKGKKKTRAKTPRVPPHKYDKIDTSGDPYRGVGRPSLYTDPAELQQEIDKYFTWILGEKGIREIEYEVNVPGTRKKQKVVEKEEYWIRRPEPPTRTGLILFIGFASHESLRKQAEVSDEFKAVCTRASAKVEHSYEKFLIDRDATRGAQFALSNMGWRNKTETQQLGKNGEPIDPVAAVVINVTDLAKNVGGI